MKPQAALITASAPPRRESNRPGRVWLIAALVLLAAPLAVAVWGLGGNAAQRERNNADTRLTRRLNSAVRDYRVLVSDANAAAATLANKHRVQRELRRSSSHVLSWRILPSRAQPQGRLTRWHRPVPAAAAVREVEFLSPEGRTVGQVVVFLPLDRHPVAWLTPISGLTGDQQLGLVRGHSVEGVNGMLRLQSVPVRQGAADIRAGGRGYRAFFERLGPAAKGIHLAALEPG